MTLPITSEPTPCLRFATESECAAFCATVNADHGSDIPYCTPIEGIGGTWVVLLDEVTNKYIEQ
jgi:hypothetical protein